MDNMNFCPACGKELPVGTAYCPACGSRLNDPEGERKEKAAKTNEAVGRIKIAVAILIITAVISIISGLYFYFNAESFAESLREMITNSLNDPVRADDMVNFVKDVVKISGLLSIIVGLFSFVPAMLAYKRRMHSLTFVTCLVVAICGNLIFGLIALYFIHKAKPAFID